MEKHHFVGSPNPNVDGFDCKYPGCGLRLADEIHTQSEIRTIMDFKPSYPPPPISTAIIEDVQKVMQPFLERQSKERRLSDVCVLAAAWISRCPDLKPKEVCAIAFDTYREIEKFKSHPVADDFNLQAQLSVAMEFGYRANEKGWNLQRAFQEFASVQKGGKQ